MSEVAIRITNLTKDYEVYRKPTDLALEILTRRSRHTSFRALDDINFDIPRGEVLGIIGSNGAGKSTLLKIITGVLDATSGSVEINGRVTAILELGLGFNPEYSGRENIYLSGLLYGMGREEVDGKINEIIAFSGLGDFIERPVKTYSSGMHSRLAFSIATAVEPEILIIDEALAAGDAAFVQKCLRRIRNLCSGGRTVILVSHGTGLLAQLCNRVVWIERGRVRMIGAAIQIVQAYDLAAHQGADPESWIETIEDLPDDPRAATPVDAAGGTTCRMEDESEGNLAPPSEFRGIFERGGELGRQVFRRGPVFIETVQLLDNRDLPTTHLTLLEPFSIQIRYRVDGRLPEPSLGVALAINNRHDLSPVAQYMTQNIRPWESRESYEEAPDRAKASESGVLEVRFEYTPFRKGEYILSIGLLPNTPASWEFYEYRHFYYPFSVDDAGMDVGAPMFLKGSLSHTALQKAKDEPPPVTIAMPTASATYHDPKPATLRGEIEALRSNVGGYPERWPRHEACPVCGSLALTLAFAKYGFQHDKCGLCGFIFVNPFPDERAISSLYSGHYYTSIRELFERPLLERIGKENPYSAPRELLEAVVLRATQGKVVGKWMDVGGGLGAFARLIGTIRPNWQVKLNEFNAHSVAIVRQTSDIQVVSSDAGTLHKAGERFDVVSSVAVLEHISHPAEFLKAYLELVKPGGWLVTIVPNFSSYNGCISHGASPNALPPFHLSLFNSGSLQRIFSQFGNLREIVVEQAGPAAFDLTHHIDTGDYWDVTVPTIECPVPQAVQVKPYDSKTTTMLNALGEANKHMGEYFAERDGRLFLIAYCRKTD